jgi:hypothetical protein
MAADDRSNGEPVELVYLPEPSWAPALLAAGIAGVVISLFTWFPYGIVGAIVALVALQALIRGSREDFRRLPRSQRVSSAVIPAVSLRRGSE